MSRRKGRLMPALQRRPEVYADLVPLYEAYRTLSAMRGGDMAPARISIEAVRAYCDFCGITEPEDRRNVLVAVQLLDNKAFELLAGKRAAEREAKRAERAARRAAGGQESNEQGDA